jgi:hypothetical protein
MAKHRTYSIEFKRQVAQEFLAGSKACRSATMSAETWSAYGFRSTKPALSTTKLGPPTCSSNTRPASRALERLVGKHVPGAFHFFDVQRKQPQSVKKELAALSSREAEYNRLSQDLTLAVTAAQSYAKRTTEEWINTRFANARLSGLRITQLASPPDFPAFPQPIIFLALGLVGGIVLASAALLPEALACVGTYDAVSRGSA